MAAWAPDLVDITSRIRSDIMKKSDSRRAIAGDNASDFKIINGVEAERVLQTVYVTPRASFEFDVPILPPAEPLQDLPKLRNLVDLDKVVVNTGFAEVGLRWPGSWGASRGTSMVASRMVCCTSAERNRSPVNLSTRKT